MASGTGYQAMAVQVGQRVELELRLNNLRQHDREHFDVTQRHLKECRDIKHRMKLLRYVFNHSTTVTFEPWPKADCLHVGAKLIDIIIHSTGLFQQSESVVFQHRTGVAGTIILPPINGEAILR